jgi:hypothetical protein
VGARLIYSIEAEQSRFKKFAESGAWMRCALQGGIALAGECFAHCAPRRITPT